MKKLVPWAIAAVLICIPMLALAQTELVDDVTMTFYDFLSDIFSAIRHFGGISWFSRIALITTLVVSSMKVTFLNKLIWEKFGRAKAWASPIFGLIAGLLALGSDGHLPSIAEAMAYMSAGSGALIFHELLDTIKVIPGLGPKWIAFIEVIESSLGGPPPGPKDEKGMRVACEK